MSDDEMEAVCRDDSPGFAPWAYWTSELYSLGRCIRAFARYPRLLPLFVYSDHGAGLHSNLYPHELTSSAKVMLTFHGLKAKRYRTLSDKRVIHVPHPWVHYRHAKGYARVQTAAGTLAFLMHRVPGRTGEDLSRNEYLELLRLLPEKFRPVVLCLHMHDVSAGEHRKLRQYGFPIVTAGNTSSVHFVDRFYEIATKFSYATSQQWGSQVAYCVELGVPYFFYGGRPRLVNLEYPDRLPGEVPYQDEFHEKYARRAEALFQEPVDVVTQEQRHFVEGVLGLDSTVSRTRMAWILWREFFRNWRGWWLLWCAPLTRSLRNRGVWGFARKITKRVRRL